uniref:Uncharacterized protein n=1 Tax=Timema monikensis TaxID=170555 RepID=A0A7R9EEM8_9NEOP|nr:unnamed protein product [Timema monikensis]
MVPQSLIPLLMMSVCSNYMGEDYVGIENEVDGHLQPEIEWSGPDTVPTVDCFRDELVPMDHFELFRSTAN